MGRNIIAFVFVVIFVDDTISLANAFNSFCHHPSSKGKATLPAFRRNPHSLGISNVEPTNLDFNDVDSWELQEDWLLMDQVPLFTVHATSRVQTIGGMMHERGDHSSATFWTQLRHSTPLLSYKNEEELENRYRVLRQRQFDEEESNTNYVTGEKGMGGKNMIQCGKSPELLTEWWTEKYSHADDHGAGAMMMGGELLNGSRIWFPLSQAGTLQGNHLRSLDDWHGDDHEQWNYAEAMGGHVYELCIPRRHHTTKKDTTRKSIDISAINSEIVPWLSSRNGSIFAIFTASILSAAIAFSADPLRQATGTSAAQITPTPITIIVQRSRLPSSSPTSICPYTNGATDITEMSLSAQRAHQELKVEREKTTVQHVQDRLKLDELKLKDLIKEENRQEAIKYGF
jgi:hypothetical protein